MKNSRQAIESLKRQIQLAYEQNPIPIEDIKALENELAFQYRMDEEFLRMKSRIQWLQAGNKNTKFFHEKCKQRRNYNRITSIADHSGRIHFDLDDVKKIISDFYDNLYTSEHSLEEWPQLPEIQKEVTPEINAKLTKPITDKEIIQAIKKMNPDKVSGPDGFTARFYQDHWATIGKSVIAFVRFFLHYQTRP